MWLPILGHFYIIIINLLLSSFLRAVKLMKPQYTGIVNYQHIMKPKLMKFEESVISLRLPYHHVLLPSLGSEFVIINSFQPIRGLRITRLTSCWSLMAYRSCSNLVWNDTTIKMSQAGQIVPSVNYQFKSMKYVKNLRFIKDGKFLASISRPT